MKTLIPALLLVFTSLSTFAQDQKASKSVYGEIFGPGFLSVNYDTRFTKKNDGFGMRVGFGYAPGIFSGDGFTIPVGLNYLIGKKKNFVELGAGASYVHFSASKDDGWFNTDGGSFVMAYGWIGYKYQPINKGFTFRAGLCPVYDGVEFVPEYFGVSFGYAFK